MTMPHDSQPSSRLSLLSAGLAAASWLAWCMYFVVFAAVIGGGLDLGGGLDQETLGFLTVLGGPLIASLLSVGLALGALVLAIRALIRRAPSRPLAIAGLVLSLGCLLPYMLIIGFLLLAGAAGNGG